MALIPDSYIGREQAFIKHRTLDTYLQRLFMIIGRHEPVVNYVDCFAGPWESEDDQALKDTSIGISLQQMKATQEALLKTFNCKVKFRALYCEKDKKAFQKLNAYLQQDHSPIETKCIHGDYTQHVQEIADWTNSHFTFFFIDPKGWKSVISADTLEPLLKLPRCEFLINLMFDFANRALSIEKHRKDMRDLFGNDIKLDGDESPLDRQQLVQTSYREKVNEIYQGWSAYVPVERPGQNKILYFLIYLTRHPMGIAVFKEQAEKMDGIQRMSQVETKLRSQCRKSETPDMFADIDPTPLVEPRYKIWTARDFILENLPMSPRIIDHDLWADWLERSDLYPSDLQQAMVELVKENSVSNLDASVEKRRKKPIKPDWPSKAERWQLNTKD